MKTKILKFLVAVVALGLILLQVNWAETKTYLSQLSFVSISLVVAVSVVGKLARFFCWYVLIPDHSVRSYFASVKVDLSLTFVNTAAISRAPGIALNPLLITKYTDEDLSTATAITSADICLFALLYGSIALGGLTLGSAVFSYQLSIALGISIIAYLVVGLSAVCIIYNPPLVTGFFDKAGSIVRLFPLGSRVVKLLQGQLYSLDDRSEAWFTRLLSSPLSVVGYTVGWFVAIGLASGIRLHVIFTALGADAPPLLFTAMFAVTAYSITILPISLGGIGVAELSATTVFIQLNIPPEVAVPAVLIDRLFGVYLPAFFGWYPLSQLDITSS